MHLKLANHLFSLNIGWKKVIKNVKDVEQDNKDDKNAIYGTAGWRHLAVNTNDKSLLESWVTTFLPDWQPPLIFVWFTSKPYDP